MTDNTYRIIVGSVVLIALYFNLEWILYGLIAIVFFEGVTNWRIPKIIYRLKGVDSPQQRVREGYRFNFEAERAFRLTVSILLAITYPFGSDNFLWFFPWFIGFATLGAGVSGICPVLALFLRIGMR